MGWGKGRAGLEGGRTGCRPWVIKGGARLDGGFRYGTGRCLNLRFGSAR